MHNFILRWNLKPKNWRSSQLTQSVIEVSRTTPLLASNSVSGWSVEHLSLNIGCCQRETGGL